MSPQKTEKFSNALAEFARRHLKLNGLINNLLGDVRYTLDETSQEVYRLAIAFDDMVASQGELSVFAEIRMKLEEAVKKGDKP